MNYGEIEFDINMYDDEEYVYEDCHNCVECKGCLLQHPNYDII